ncbi:gliding motility protein GldL [Arcicella sp. LKC2W]|uniref:type IX secretion system motor protein PorL/GldL n=1 Tax=Arcicella sp. LKC2W TaxID=2984198 RepID=UPI002B211F4D|nr:gliding motility protein GldL [Arcicella sp. LKC2W]MEA5460133.1 gliding motility protein GldL [Arcicella sp. LKC2W]
MERIINVIASFGAAVVIVGALFKILHWNGANEMLMVGMFTEAAIFILFGVLYLAAKPEKQYEWERVYPELSKDFSGELPKRSVAAPSTGTGITAKMDEMLANARVTPDIFDNLGKGMKSLTDTVSKIGDITDATIATSDYAKNVKSASGAMGEMNKAYGATMNAMSEMSSATQDAKDYRVQFQKVTQNMGALNAVYELELQDTNKHLKAMNTFYGNLTTAMENMADASKDTQQFKQELSKLTTNLSSLNNVYGSMLSAMKG